MFTIQFPWECKEPTMHGIPTLYCGSNYSPASGRTGPTRRKSCPSNRGRILLLPTSLSTLQRFKRRGKATLVFQRSWRRPSKRYRTFRARSSPNFLLSLAAIRIFLSSSAPRLMLDPRQCFKLLTTPFTILCHLTSRLRSLLTKLTSYSTVVP
jgi:hypothetical protein